MMKPCHATRLTADANGGIKSPADNAANEVVERLSKY
jgi:hypothetical protein